MPSLLEVQEGFARALFTGEDAAAPFVQGGALSPSERLAIYRNNVLVNYRNALRDTYPAIVRLVGDDFFNAAAHRFAREQCSSSGDLHDYGEDFAGFLQAFAPARDLPYLPDVARLEWRMHRVFHAADAEPLRVEAFAALSEAGMADARLQLIPATALLRSDYPVTRIWQLAQSDQESGTQTIDVNEGPQHVLVVRRHYTVQLEPLGVGSWTLLDRLGAGTRFGDALDAALEVEAEFDLAGFLAHHVPGGTFARFLP